MTNLELIREARAQLQEAEPTKDIDTYKGWQNRGYQVQKGQKAVEALEGRGSAKDYSKSKRGRRYFYNKKIYLFGSWQVKTFDGKEFKPEELNSEAIDPDFLNAFS